MSEQDTDRASVWILTALTRRSAQGRRVVIVGLDIPMRRGIVAMVALAIALVPTGITWPLVGEFALLWILLIEVVAFVLVESRTRNGLHLRRYQALLDSRRATQDIFYCCGVPIDPRPDRFVLLTRSTVPGPTHTLDADRAAAARAYGDPSEAKMPADSPAEVPVTPRRSRSIHARSAPARASVSLLEGS